MDMNDILGTLRAGLNLVQQAAPLAALGGPAVAGVANIVAGLAEIGETALRNIETGTLAAGSDDQAALKEILKELQGRNDVIASDIARG